MKEMSENLNTIIGKDAKLVGEINSEGSIRIDGKVEGTIDAKGFLTIGPTANVKAEIHAKEAIISGIVDGNITVDDRLELEKAAQIRGDINAKVLTVNTGAKFNGKCQMGSKGAIKVNTVKEDEPEEPQIL